MFNFSSTNLLVVAATTKPITKLLTTALFLSNFSILQSTASSSSSSSAGASYQNFTNEIILLKNPLPYYRNHNVINNVIIDDLLEPWAYHLTALILFLIGFIGFSLNLFVIILMCKDIQLWTPMNIILFNLVCSDFLVSIMGNPFTLMAALSHKWIFGPVVCIAYGFFMALLGITSITTLTVLSYERYCLVRYPLSTRKINNRGAFICILFIWMYSLALTMPPLFGWGAYVNEAANISCSVNWETQNFNATTYIVFLFVFGLILPLFIIIFSYVNIILTMRQNSLRLGRKNRAEKRITYMVAIMITAFMIAWTPYSLFALIEQFGPSDLITPQMAVLPALIAKSSICYNPIIYIGLNTQFKASWKRHIFKETTGMETTANQLSQTNESMIAIDCTTPKQLRNHSKKIQKFCMKTGTNPTIFSVNCNKLHLNRLHKNHKKLLSKKKAPKNTSTNYYNHNNNTNNNNNNNSIPNIGDCGGPGNTETNNEDDDYLKNPPNISTTQFNSEHRNSEQSTSSTIVDDIDNNKRSNEIQGNSRQFVILDEPSDELDNEIEASNLNAVVLDDDDDDNDDDDDDENGSTANSNYSTRNISVIADGDRTTTVLTTESDSSQMC